MDRIELKKLIAKLLAMVPAEHKDGKKTDSNWTKPRAGQTDLHSEY